MHKTGSPPVGWGTWLLPPHPNSKDTTLYHTYKQRKQKKLPIQNITYGHVVTKLNWLAFQGGVFEYQAVVEQRSGNALRNIAERCQTYKWSEVSLIVGSPANSGLDSYPLLPPLCPFENLGNKLRCLYLLRQSCRKQETYWVCKRLCFPLYIFAVVRVG